MRFQEAMFVINTSSATLQLSIVSNSWCYLATATWWTHKSPPNTGLQRENQATLTTFCQVWTLGLTQDSPLWGRLAQGSARFLLRSPYSY